MQHLSRFVFTLLMAVTVTGGLRAMEDPGAAPGSEGLAPVIKPITVMKRPLAPTEYKRNDMSFYPKNDFEKDHSGAVIVPQEKVEQKDDSYFFTPKIRAPKTIYVETLTDWIEPITPPDMPASLGVPPDAMQIREPQGDVQVALPSAPANFSAATEGMTLPNGAVVKTGANGTAAVLFGGVDSARLMPDSAAAVQQTVTANSRSAEVDLTAGGVFSKVGTQVGVKGSYSVHTPFGNADAKGGDFATVIASNRADVWVAQGTVNFENPAANAAAASVTSDGTGPLRILRAPAIADTHPALLADAETLTPVLNFIPLANQKVKALRAKQSGGGNLSDNEKAYLGRIKQVAALMKLDLVPPPAPVVVALPPAPAPVAMTTPAPAAAEPTPTPATAPTPQPAPPKPAAVATAKPLSVNIHTDGTIGFRGSKMDLAAFQSKLADIGKATPDQAFSVHPSSDVPADKLQAVLDSFHAAKLENVSVAARKVVAAPVIPVAPVASVEPAAPAQPETPAPSTTAANPSPPSETPAPSPASPAPETAAPTIAATTPSARLSLPPEATTSPKSSESSTDRETLIVTARADGKVRFHGATTDLATFQAKLADIAKSTPDQEFVVRAGPTVPQENVQAIMDSFHAANLTHVTLSGHPAPPTVTAAASPTETTPPAPESTPPPAPVAETPVPTISPSVPAPRLSLPAPPKPVAVATKKPLSVNVHDDGSVGFRGSRMDLSAFQAKLADVGKATPDQAFVVHPSENVPHEKLQAVLDSFQAANLANVSVAAMPVNETPKAAAAPATEPPAPHLAADATVAKVPDSAPAHPPKAPPENPTYIAYLRVDGMVKFRGATMDLPELKDKLAAAAQATPEQQFHVNAPADVPYEKIKAVLDTFTAAGVKYVSLDIHSPDPEPVVHPKSSASAGNPLSPDLMLHPAMQVTSPDSSQPAAPAAGTPAASP